MDVRNKKERTQITAKIPLYSVIHRKRQKVSPGDEKKHPHLYYRLGINAYFCTPIIIPGGPGLPSCVLIVLPIGQADG